MTDGAEDPAPADKRVLEDVLDEVLSFNYRSLRTLRDIIFRPARVARAFLDGDRESYTPPMRVWFGVLTWMFLLSAVWGGWGDIVWRAGGNGAAFESMIVEGRRDLEAVRQAISATSALIFVPVEALFILPGTLLVQAMKPGMRFVTAAQCYFIPVTAAAVATTAQLTLSAFWPGILGWLSLVNLALFAVIAAAVIHSGLARSPVGLVVKTAILSLTVTGLGMLARIVTLFASIMWAILVAVPPSA